MKRLVVTGIACPPETWEKFLGKSKTQRIISLAEVISRASSDDPRVMADYVAHQIEIEKPDSLVCHGLGVTLTLAALLRLGRRGKVPHARVTLFNGVFRRTKLSKSKHLLRAQFLSLDRAINELQANGGDIDLRLHDQLGRIRKMCRRLIARGLTEKLGEWLGVDQVISIGGKSRVRLPIQIISSPNDPYISTESIDQIEKDFTVERRIEINYGHFPYSVKRSLILPHVREFEKRRRSFSHPIP